MKQRRVLLRLGGVSVAAICLLAIGRFLPREQSAPDSPHAPNSSVDSTERSDTDRAEPAEGSGTASAATYVPPEDRVPTVLPDANRAPLEKIKNGSSLLHALSTARYSALDSLLFQARSDGAASAFQWVRERVDVSSSTNLVEKHVQEMLVRALPVLLRFEPLLAQDIQSFLLGLARGGDARPNLRIQALGALFGLDTSVVTGHETENGPAYTYRVTPWAWEALGEVLGYSATWPDGAVIYPLKETAGYADPAIVRELLRPLADIQGSIPLQETALLAMTQLPDPANADYFSGIARDRTRNSLIREAGMECLVRVDEAVAATLILERLQDRTESSWLVSACLHRIADVSASTDQIVGVLSARSRDESSQVRTAAITAAAKYHAKGPDARFVTLLQESLALGESPDPNERELGMAALKAIWDAGLLAEFVPILESLSKTVRDPAIAAWLRAALEAQR